MYKLSLFLHNKMSSQVAPSHGPPDLRIQDILISKTTIKKKSHKSTKERRALERKKAAVFERRQEYSSLSNYLAPIKYSYYNIITIINKDDRQPFVFAMKK